jgi:membrane protease YdiL (CAAX protease family)
MELMKRVRPEEQAPGAAPPCGAAAVVAAPAGWYPDPGGRHQFRYWDGARWTPGVADAGRIGQEWPQPTSWNGPPPGWGSAPPRGGGPGWPPALPPLPEADLRVGLPRRSVVFPAAGIVAALVLAVAGSLLAAVIAPKNQLALAVLSQAGLWTGFLVPVVAVSRRYGTGNLWRDFGVRSKGTDVWRGLGFSVLGRVAGLFVVLPLIDLNHKFSGSDLRPILGARGHPLLYAVMIFIAVIGAPFVEELFFRGLLLRSLVPLTGAATAIGVQAVVFASLHLRPSYGLGNVSVFAAIVVMGIVQGIIAERYRRLGPAMLSHGFFNLAAVLSIVAR